MDGDLRATAGDLGRAIGAGTVDPVDLTERYLAAIAAHPDADRIYARLTPDRARGEAKAAAEAMLSHLELLEKAVSGSAH